MTSCITWKFGSSHPLPLEKPENSTPHAPRSTRIRIAKIAHHFIMPDQGSPMYSTSKGTRVRRSHVFPRKLGLCRKVYIQPCSEFLLENLAAILTSEVSLNWVILAIRVSQKKKETVSRYLAILRNWRLTDAADAEYWFYQAITVALSSTDGGKGSIAESEEQWPRYNIDISVLLFRSMVMFLPIRFKHPYFRSFLVRPSECISLLLWYWRHCHSAPFLSLLNLDIWNEMRSLCSHSIPTLRSTAPGGGITMVPFHVRICPQPGE